MKEDAIDFSKVFSFGFVPLSDSCYFRFWSTTWKRLLEEGSPVHSGALEPRIELGGAAEGRILHFKYFFPCGRNSVDSPIWMDSTTFKECQHLEKEMGGYEEVAKITGSRYLSTVFHHFLELTSDSLATRSPRSTTPSPISTRRPRESPLSPPSPSVSSWANMPESMSRMVAA